MELAEWKISVIEVSDSIRIIVRFSIISHDRIMETWLKLKLSWNHSWRNNANVKLGPGTSYTCQIRDLK